MVHVYTHRNSVYIQFCFIYSDVLKHTYTHTCIHRKGFSHASINIYILYMSVCVEREIERI